MILLPCDDDTLEFCLKMLRHRKSEVEVASEVAVVSSRLTLVVLLQIQDTDDMYYNFKNFKMLS